MQHSNFLYQDWNLWCFYLGWGFFDSLNFLFVSLGQCLLIWWNLSLWNKAAGVVGHWEQSSVQKQGRTILLNCMLHYKRELNVGNSTASVSSSGNYVRLENLWTVPQLWSMAAFRHKKCILPPTAQPLVGLCSDTLLITVIALKNMLYLRDYFLCPRGQNIINSRFKQNIPQYLAHQSCFMRGFQ